MAAITTGTVRMIVPEILTQRNITVADFARKTGLAYNTASALARGHFDRVGMDTLAAICAGLEVTPADLFLYTPA